MRLRQAVRERAGGVARGSKLQTMEQRERVVGNSRGLQVQQGLLRRMHVLMRLPKKRQHQCPSIAALKQPRNRHRAYRNGRMNVRAHAHAHAHRGVMRGEVQRSRAVAEERHCQILDKRGVDGHGHGL